MAYISISWPEHDVADRFTRPATDTLFCAASLNYFFREIEPEIKPEISQVFFALPI
jgi:hypothetical protein